MKQVIEGEKIKTMKYLNKGDLIQLREKDNTIFKVLEIEGTVLTLKPIKDILHTTDRNISIISLNQVGVVKELSEDTEEHMEKIWDRYVREIKLFTADELWWYTQDYRSIRKICQMKRINGKQMYREMFESEDRSFYQSLTLFAVRDQSNPDWKDFDPDDVETIMEDYEIEVAKNAIDKALREFEIARIKNLPKKERRRYEGWLSQVETSDSEGGLSLAEYEGGRLVYRNKKIK